MGRVYRRLPWPAIPLALALLGPVLGAVAGGDPRAGSGKPEGALRAYAGSFRNRLLIGVNSVLTFPADPFVSALDPPEEFSVFPGGAVSRHLVGLGQGALLGAYRVSMGALDIAFSPLTPVVVLSPEPRYLLFDDAEHPAY